MIDSITDFTHGWCHRKQQLPPLLLLPILQWYQDPEEGVQVVSVSNGWYSQAPAANGLLPLLRLRHNRLMIAAGGAIIVCLLMAIPTELLHVNSFALAIHVQLYSSGRISSSRKMQTLFVRWVYSSYVRNEKLRNLSINDDALASVRWPPTCLLTTT